MDYKKQINLQEAMKKRTIRLFDKSLKFKNSN